MESSSSTPTATYVAPGDILSTNAEQFRQQLAAILDKGGEWKLLELDLRASRLVDSVGLNAIVSAIKRTKSRGGDVRIRVRHPSVARLFAFTRLDQHAQVING